MQRFFMGHTDEVLCMDMHPTRSLVASGQRGRLPKVRMMPAISPRLEWKTLNKTNARVARFGSTFAYLHALFKPDRRLSDKMLRTLRRPYCNVHLLQRRNYVIPRVYTLFVHHAL